MVSNEALFTSLVIDAFEKRDVAMFDVAEAFLLLTLPKRRKKKVLLKLKGVFVDIMCEVNPEYSSTMMNENEKRSCTC